MVFEYRPKIWKWFIISILFQLPLWKFRQMISFKLYHQYVYDKLRGLNIEIHQLKAGHSYNIMFYGQLERRFVQTPFSTLQYFTNHHIFIQSTTLTNYNRLLNKYVVFHLEEFNWKYNYLHICWVPLDIFLLQIKTN